MSISNKDEECAVVMSISNKNERWVCSQNKKITTQISER